METTLLPRKNQHRREEKRDEILAGMDSVSRSRRIVRSGSGGKVVRARRRARTRTPYERSSPTEKRPNWLATLLGSPARSIFTGAGKVLSSVLGSDSESEIGSDDDEGEDEFVSSEEDELNKRNGASEPLFRPEETKHTIEKLLRQETLSREECDYLIEIVRSRVVEGAQNTRLGASMQHGRLRSGTWNIQEEIKRVRTKANEEMLRSLPSSKVDWSFSWENRSSSNSLQNGKQGADLGEKLKNPITAECLIMDPSLGTTTTHNTDVKEKIHDGLQNEALPRGTEQPNSNVEETIQDSLVYDQPCSTTENHVTFDTANASPSSKPSLSTQVCREETTVSNGEINQASSSQRKIAIDILEEKTYELDNVISENNELDMDGIMAPEYMPLNETTAKAPKTNENDTNFSKNTDTTASGSQNSSGLLDKLSQGLLTHSPPKPNNATAVKEENIVEKLRAKRLTEYKSYNRRGRPHRK